MMTQPMALSRHNGTDDRPEKVAGLDGRQRPAKGASHPKKPEVAAVNQAAALAVWRGHWTADIEIMNNHSGD